MEVIIGGSTSSKTLSHLDPAPDITRIGDGTDQLDVNADGSLNVTSSGGPLATEATLASVDGKTPALVNGRVPVDIGASIAIDVADIGFDVNNFGDPETGITPAAGGTGVIGFLSGILRRLGQALTVSVNNLPAVQPVDDNGGSLTVDGTVSVSNFPASQPVTGPLTDAELRATAVPVSGAFYPATQDVSGTVAVSNFPATQPVSGTVSVGNFPATQAISAASLPLPAGAATEATLASALAAITATTSGKPVVATARNVYSGTIVTTGAWTQIFAATAATITELEIFDSSGQTLELGTGAAAAETRLMFVTPGGNGRVPVRIAAGTRLAIRAVSANANAGELVINAYGV